LLVPASIGLVSVDVMVDADSVVISACLLGWVLVCVRWVERRWRLVGFRSGAEEAAVLATVRRLVFR
jgi:hypothetical protein